MPPTVLVATRGKIFHADKGCPGLSWYKDLVEIAITEIGVQRPCYRCYPDAPRAKTVRRYCQVCKGKTIRPCRHNGGVLVSFPVRLGKRTLTSEADDTYTRTRWVWPEHAARY